MSSLVNSLGLGLFLIAVGWVLWLCYKIRAYRKMEHELHEQQIKQEYDAKVKEYLDHDLDTRVMLSNKRLGLSEEPEGDE